MSEETTSPIETQDAHHLEQQRREKRDAIASLGVDPYGSRTPDLIALNDARAKYDAKADESWNAETARAKEASEDANPELDTRPRVRVAGRVVLKRGQGKLIWLQLRDHTTAPAQLFDDPDVPTPLKRKLEPDLQIAVSKKDVDDTAFAIVRQLDLGDTVVADGAIMKTKSGEVTLWASDLKIASKSITPPPEKWSGLTDIDQRYRKRYVDLHTNPRTMWTMRMRSRLMALIRTHMEARGYLEVDTPILQAQAGGAAARPFQTHMNAIHTDLFMRIAPELYLKRLLVGGMPRVYEVSRNFRNEGLSPRHNPEFTSMEAYEAFGDYNTMMELAEGLVRACAAYVCDDHHDAGDLTLPFGDLRIDYASDFVRVTFRDLYKEALGFDVDDTDSAMNAAPKHKVRTHAEDGTPRDPILIVNDLFEEVAEPTIDPERPTFVTDYPSALSPLTKPKRDDPDYCERWDLFIGNMEIGPAYTELNDPDVQARKFREQLAGQGADEDTFRNFDDDFIHALKVGMPPAGGIGLGLDRLCMLLLDAKSIRDVILFPMMRPEAEQSGGTAARNGA
ncbi:MAG: lysine--tRNA ligase [Planctomycetota bacterium]